MITLDDQAVLDLQDQGRRMDSLRRLYAREDELAEAVRRLKAQLKAAKRALDAARCESRTFVAALRRPMPLFEWAGRPAAPPLPPVNGQGDLPGIPAAPGSAPVTGAPTPGHDPARYVLTPAMLRCLRVLADTPAGAKIDRGVGRALVVRGMAEPAAGGKVYRITTEGEAALAAQTPPERPIPPAPEPPSPGPAVDGECPVCGAGCRPVVRDGRVVAGAVVCPRCCGEPDLSASVAVPVPPVRVPADRVGRPSPDDGWETTPLQEVAPPRWQGPLLRAGLTTLADLAVVLREGATATLKGCPRKPAPGFDRAEDDLLASLRDTFVSGWRGWTGPRPAWLRWPEEGGGE